MVPGSAGISSASDRGNTSYGGDGWAEDEWLWTGWLVVNRTDEDDFGLDEARENWPERMGSPGVVVLR